MKFRRIGTLRLLEMLGEWSSGNRPLYELLSEALRRCIDQGDLRPGTRLPSERSVASSLAVSRTTVVAALSRLKQDGYMDSAPGSGTWVRAVRGFSPLGGVVTPTATVGRNPLFSRLGVPVDGAIDLTAAVLGPSPLVAKTIEEANRRVGYVVEGTGYFPAGLPRLREIVADWFTGRGLATEEEEILITTGGQQGIMLIAAAYIQPGDPVVAESPTYPGALDAFRLVGASVRTVHVSEAGVACDDIVRAIEARQPRISYLIPTFHNPTGTVMAELERRRLARYLATEPQTVVIEDESLVELSLTEEPPPRPLASHHDGVLTVGSASKPFWGGLRVGWVRGPPEIIRRLTHYKTVFDLATPTTTQATACLLLERSDEILAERRRHLTVRQEALCQAVSAMLPDWDWIPPAGGLSIWARMPRGSATELAQVALRHGLVLVPGPFFDPHAHHDMFFRLPYVLPAATLEHGVGRLARAWEQYCDRGDTSASHTA